MKGHTFLLVKAGSYYKTLLAIAKLFEEKFDWEFKIVSYSQHLAIANLLQTIYTVTKQIGQNWKIEQAQDGLQNQNAKSY